MQIIAFTCRCFVYQEHLGVLTATCAARKRLQLCARLRFAEKTLCGGHPMQSVFLRE